MNNKEIIMYVYWYHLLGDFDISKHGYVGVSSNLKQRHYHHSTGRTNKHLTNAFKKYGVDNILRKIILEGSEKECLLLEAILRPTENIGWNIASGGGLPPSNKGKQHSVETKKKISRGNTGKSRPNIFKGVTNRWSEDMKKTIGSYHKGKVISEEHKQSAREKLSGSNSVFAKEISLYHIDNVDIIYTFGSVKEASKALDINYSTLRSQIRRAKGSAFKGGWVLKLK
jgi:group I intron endonuclease